MADNYRSNINTTGQLAINGGASAASAGTLAVGGATQGVLEAGEVDWYAVTLNAGAYYWFDLDGSKEGGGTLTPGFNPSVLRLVDANGKVLATSEYAYGGTGSVLPYTAAAAGTYYVEVASPGASGTYTVKAQLGETDDYGNDAANAGAIQPDVVVNGKLELLSDKDVFKLAATAGVTYAVELAPGVGAGSNWSSNASLAITNDQVFVSTRDASIGGKSYKLFEATTSGDYYFTVQTSYGDSGVTGAYTLTVNPQGADDFTGTVLSTGLLAPSAPVKGVIDLPGDHDWIKVHLELGGTYVFDLQGLNSGNGTLDTVASSSTMALRAADGSYLGVSSSTEDGEPRLSYIATQSGDYFVDVYANGNQTGSYTLVETLASADVTAPQLLASTLTPGATNVGTMPQFVLTFNESIRLGGGITLADSDGVAVNPPFSSWLVSVVGKQLVINPHINLQPGMTYTLSLPAGSVLDQAGNQATFAQSYSFTITQPVVTGTDGNDYLIGGRGMALNGGAGTDTVYYGDEAGLYYTQTTRNADGTVTVRDASKGTVDQLAGVERLLFTDRAVALDVDGVGGQVYRLYQAAFDRGPAPDGAGFWISAMDRGTSLTTVANNFIQSQEFTKLYGSAPTDAEFVKLLYNNVLNRDPLPAGNAFWLDGLANGTTRAETLIAFSESVENTAAMATIIANGFAYTPYG